MCTSGLTEKARADHCPSSDTKTEIINGQFVTHGCKYDEDDVALALVVAAGVLVALGLVGWLISKSSKDKEQDALEKVEGAFFFRDKTNTFVKWVKHSQLSTPEWLVVEKVRFDNGSSKPDFAVGINILAIGDGR